ncbi:hypothetical protein D9619_012820 [Psilocybe cf. subviscida]|uniref:Uncharacterized protein n=1 Tax=Psilocybe cf. subviscida TaxID=2480587 RepID=A0A8H5AQK6_9AGAR|nr:hypothetical protein D9619_012820 [Psilocybe cf. subviscida]
MTIVVPAINILPMQDSVFAVGHIITACTSQSSFSSTIVNKAGSFQGLLRRHATLQEESRLRNVVSLYGGKFRAEQCAPNSLEGVMSRPNMVRAKVSSRDVTQSWDFNFLHLRIGVDCLSFDKRGAASWYLRWIGQRYLGCLGAGRWLGQYGGIGLLYGHGRRLPRVVTWMPGMGGAAHSTGMSNHMYRLWCSDVLDITGANRAVGSSISVPRVNTPPLQKV